MDNPKNRAVLEPLDQLAKEEYGTGFAEALENQPEDMFVRRLARLSGIPLKQPFARPLPSDGQSATGALRYWELRPEIQDEVSYGNGLYPVLEGMQSDPVYTVVEELAKQQFDTSKPSLTQIAATIHNAQNESSWFAELIKAIRPRICNQPSERNSLLIESFKKAGEELANKRIEVVLTVIIEPLTKQLIDAVPFLHFVPHVTAMGLAYYIVKFASNRFCEIEILPQFTLLFGDSFDRR
ncbi:MAG: hypothetical protein JO061_24490 [Acidobacteriaceae bacterium]|nr:hypothetical protein [Acidobacteriaceae bacterium]